MPLFLVFYFKTSF